MKVILTILAAVLALPLLLLVAVTFGPVALAAAGILAVFAVVVAGMLLAARALGFRMFGPFPEPTAERRTHNQPVAPRGA
ncbi:MAG TPA: hypothetical protein VH418_17945 [Solirubrobacteraceae bacterium]